MQPSEFLRALYGEFEHGQLAIWDLQSRSTTWFESDELHQVDALCAHNKVNKKDTYYGVGLQSARNVAGRGDAAGTCAIPGVWADVDVADLKADAKKCYPTDEQVAQVLSLQMPLKPSVVIKTGGGYHCYWLLHEPLQITDDAARRRAAKLCSGWQLLLKRKFKEFGRDLDSTADLARVLRVPGSWSVKHDCPIELAETWQSADPDEWARYDIGDIEQYLPEDDGRDPIAGRQPYRIGKITIDQIPVPQGKFDVLRENSEEFRKTWDHKRKLPSSSEYEMSLASIAASAGWSDQEIARLLAQHRLKYEPEKFEEKFVKRADYVVNTIKRAREGLEETDSIQRLRAVTDEPGVTSEIRQTIVEGVAAAEVVEVVDKKDDNDIRDDIAETLSASLGIKVSGWLQEGRENPVYSVITADGRFIRLPVNTDIVESGARVLAQRIYEETGIVIKTIAKKDWAPILRALTRIGTVRDYREARASTSVGYWLDDYLAHNSARMRDDAGAVDAACSKGQPFLVDGSVHIQIERLLTYISSFGRTGISKPVLLSCLRQLGFERKQINYYREVKGGEKVRSSAQYWAAKLPAGNFAGCEKPEAE
jgi:hypothetical protein